MGRVASAGDNAALESWNALLQTNVLNRRRWATRDELHEAIVFWIERTYNRRRRQRALGKLTPVECELAFAAQNAALAASSPLTRGQPTLQQSLTGFRARLRGSAVRLPSRRGRAGRFGW